MNKILLATIIASASFISSAQNNSYGFLVAGGDQYGDVIGMNHGINGNFTICSFYNISSVADIGYVFDIRNNSEEGSLFYVNDQNNVTFGFGTYGTFQVSTNPFPMSFNTWYHVAVIKENTNLYLALNGLVIDTITGVNATSAVCDDLLIGRKYIELNHFFDGLIDDFHIWNYALSEQEIQDFIDCHPTGNEAGLMGYWDFNQGTGSIFYDQTTNGNNGTMYNGADFELDFPTFNCGAGISELGAIDQTLIKIVDLMGRETDPKPNTPLIYVYSDGTTEKVFRVE